MKFIAVYDKDATEYESDRLGFLENAKDVCIEQSINGDYELTFILPKGDKKWGLIDFERKVGYDGRIFRIKDIDDCTISASTLLQDACRTHVQYIGDMINTPANEIMEGIFSKTPYVTVLKKEEIEALGLEPVTDKIDFFEMSKTTPIACLNRLMETLKKYRVHSEVYIDNDKIGLVRQLGTKKDFVIDPRYNGCEIKPKISTYTLVTKLYPYGKDDLPLEGDKQYILSPNYDTLGEYEGFCNFDEVTDQEDLLLAAQTQFRADNPERIDVPKYAVNVKVLDLPGEINLGDIVTVNDINNGIKSNQRVITVKKYPYEPHKNSIVVGVPPINMIEAFSGMFTAHQYLRLAQNERNEYKTNTLEFMKKNEDVTVENNGEYQKIAQYETGAMFVSDDGKYAVALIDGKIKIGAADKSRDDGWNWIGVFGHGDGSDWATTYLYTNLITIMSENGKLKIEDNLIQMYDGNGTLRYQSGLNPQLGKYVFELFDESGKKSLYMDDNGNLTICGVFMTGENGQTRTVIDGNGIQSYNSDNQLHGLVSNPDGRHSDLATYYNGVEIFKLYNDIDGVTFYCNNSKLLTTLSNKVSMNGTWYYKNTEIATKDDIQSLQEQINALKGM
ncbi:phage tail spike protein [Monoglobus pectinilyticus]|uniref:phage tail spike protein n=1 Tax=Monoglobus pectinilyticus TaxID=1981510 RepID=UPI00399AF5A0